MHLKKKRRRRKPKRPKRMRKMQNKKKRRPEERENKKQILKKNRKRQMIVKANKAKGKIETRMILFPKVLKALLMPEQTIKLNLIPFLPNQKLAEVEEVVVMIEGVEAMKTIEVLAEEVVEDKNLRNKMTMKISYSLKLLRIINRMRLILLLLTEILNQL